MGVVVEIQIYCHNLKKELTLGNDFERKTVTTLIKRYSLERNLRTPSLKCLQQRCGISDSVLTHHGAVMVLL